MSHIVVLGAGLGGTIIAYEMRDKLRSEDRLTVVTLGTSYSFVPSNPYEGLALDVLGIKKLKAIHIEPAE